MSCLPFTHNEGEIGLPPQQDLISLRRVFDACDANGDGFLTLEELCEWMRKLGLLLTRDGLKELIATCDHNLDGRLDFDEFLELSASMGLQKPSIHAQSEQVSTGFISRDIKESTMKNSSSDCGSDTGHEDLELREAFLVFDKDGNGLISPSELRSTLSQLGLLAASTSFSRIHSIIRRVDSDGDGEVSFAEFQDMMKGSVSS